LLAWRSGKGTLGQVLEARRVRLDVLLARLDLQYDAFKRRLELNYLAGG
jgi:outer membrane protein TolC